MNGGRADRVLKLEHESRADRAHDGWRAPFEPLLVVMQVDVLRLCHVEDSAATGRHGGAAALGLGAENSVRLEGEHARRLRSSRQLVHRPEGRVLRNGRGILGARGRRVHVGQRVRRRRGVVPDGERTVLVAEAADGIGVGDQPGHVGHRRECAHPQRPVRILLELPLQLLHVRPASLSRLANVHDVGDRIAPGEQVGVVFVRPHKHHRPPRLAQSLPLPLPLSRGARPQPEHRHESVGGRGGSRTDEKHPVALGAACIHLGQRARLAHKVRRLFSCLGARGVGVAVVGENFLEKKTL
mmetsp:Transcript_27465/g.83566  ORF Transcript_27465/g.83566 Transcript_27465/m.83566 type:complete len:298 (+) Transcript_27465:668-1561(+)